MTDVRAGDPYVCVRCTIGDHTECLGPVCECLHAHGGWIQPGRRKALREGSEPQTDQETEYRIAYRAHLEDRRAADQRRD